MKAGLTPEEVDSIIDATRSIRDHALLVLICRSACRISEALGLDYDDVDWEDNALIIKHLKSGIPDKKRMIPVSREVIVCLGMLGVKRGRLFPITRWQAYDIVLKAAEAAGFVGKCLTLPSTGRKHCVSPHRMRDAAAMRWLTKRKDIIGLQGLQHQLGHTDMNMTMRYIKQSPEQAHELYSEVFGE